VPRLALAEFMRVAALTGMRREEIGQLRLADCAGGVFIVQQGKTAAARRRVPIHSELAALVARRSKGKMTDAFLFHELRSQNSERTDPIGKVFTRYRRSLGIQFGTGRRSLVTFHSFRRWFITRAVNAGQPPHIVSLLVGHKEGRKGMTLGRYWQGAEDDALRACVEAVKLPTQAPIAVPSGPLQSAA
jgi:integrase